MARLLSIFVIPILGIGLIAYFLPDAPLKAAKVVKRAARVVMNQPAVEEEPPPAAPTVYEQLVIPTVTVGPEYAEKPELRIWAIRNDRNYGWIQLPRGTEVLFIRQDGDYYVVRYEETIIRAHRSVFDAGLVTLKKSRTYAVAY